MNTIFEKFRKIGIIPVVVLEDAKDAKPLGKALMEGGLPCAEDFQNGGCRGID